MANIWEKAISTLAGNLNSGLSYLITTVKMFFKKHDSPLIQGAKLTEKSTYAKTSFQILIKIKFPTFYAFKEKCLKTSNFFLSSFD